MKDCKGPWEIVRGQKVSVSIDLLLTRACTRSMSPKFLTRRDTCDNISVKLSDPINQMGQTSVLAFTSKKAFKI